jgi:hypothetical protein
LPPWAAQGGNASKDRLRLVEIHGHDLTAIASVPPQGSPFEQIGIVITQEQAQPQ